MQYIKINEELKTNLISKFSTYLNSARLNDKHIHFSATLDTPEEIVKTNIFIEAAAYLKMMIYVRDTNTEIAWHGTVERNQEKNYYYIKDVFLYPQKLAAATVQTDQDKYNKWLEELDDETYNKLRFQGHSHVNFGVTPSGTDLNYYNDILQVLPSTDYYIFMIMNKSGDMTFLVYDLAKNIVYNTQDVNVRIVNGTTIDLVNEIETQKETFCEKPVYTPPTWPNYSGYNYEYPGYDDDYPVDAYQSKTKKIPTKYQLKTDKLFDEIDKKYKNTKLNLKEKKIGK